MQLRRWLPDRQLVIVADSSFAAILWLFQLSRLPGQICLIVRFRLDAALYEPAPARQPHQHGAPRERASACRPWSSVAQHRKTQWQRVTIPDWYGEGQRIVEIVSDTAVWYHSGQPPLPIRWVLIRDPKGKFKTQALLCTDLNIDARSDHQVVCLALAIGSHPARSPRASGRRDPTPVVGPGDPADDPALLALFSLVTLLAHQHARAASCRSGRRPGITSPSRPSAMRWRWCAGKSGSMSVFRRSHSPSDQLKNARRRFKTGCFQPCVTRPEGRRMDKVQLRTYL